MRLGQERAQRRERIALAGLKGLGVGQRLAVDLGPLAGRTKDQVRIEADHRVPAALRSALDRLKQEHIAGAAPGELEIGRDRGLEIGHQRRHRDGRPAGLIGARKNLVVGNCVHQPPSADCMALS